TAALLATAAYADGIKADIRPAEERDYSGYTVILHSNDVHGAVDGYAEIAWLRTQLEDMGAEVILADAGDFSQGGAAVNMNKGADAVRLMNAVGYDIAAVGNHEFDYGPERMMENLGGAEFTVVCSNILKDGEPVFAPSAMYETESGLKIGFFGVETPETLTKSNPKFTAGFEILDGDDMYAAAQAETDALISDGADIVIALTHLGVDAESVNSGNGSPNLCAGVSGIDLMIDGHSHTVMTSGADGEPIQSTGTKFAYIGLVLISPEGVIEDRYLVPTDDLGSDDDVAAATQVISDALDETYGEVIAVCETDVTV
ncbi:MAG: metallophosphatase, partial [Clostridia bacterium]|nr:metallophosphatase [Clostridia bacterium]